MEIFNRFKELLESKNRRKLIENAAIIIIIGVIIIIVGSTFFSGKEKPAANDSNTPGTDSIETSAAVTKTSDDMETKLKYILSQVEGAGKVEVMITYSTGKENIPAYDTKTSENSTDEKDSGGGTRKIAQSSSDSAMVFQNGENGDKTPVIIKEIEPVAKGVLVVAEGASDPQVREKLNRAVQVLLDIPVHKIQVMERKK